MHYIREFDKVRIYVVNGNYFFSEKYNDKVIELQSPAENFTGIHTYVITYTYDIGKDLLKDADEFCFNLKIAVLNYMEPCMILMNIMHCWLLILCKIHKLQRRFCFV